MNRTSFGVLMSAFLALPPLAACGTSGAITCTENPCMPQCAHTCLPPSLGSCTTDSNCFDPELQQCAGDGQCAPRWPDCSNGGTCAHGFSCATAPKLCAPSCGPSVPCPAGYAC